MSRRKTHRDNRTGVFWKRCPTCGKRTYRDKLDALQVAAYAAATGAQRVYKCGNGYHLTRAPERNR